MILNFNSTLPGQFSDIAADVDNLYNFILWSSFAFFGIVVFTILYFIYKYRSENVRTKIEKQVSHNVPLEFFWTLIPTILIIIVFFWGAESFIRMQAPRDNYEEILVTASNWQFAFSYNHPDGMFTVQDSLVIPEGKNIRLLMTANKSSFIHALYIPDFRVKRDLSPNRYSQMWFKSEHLGTYGFYCTRYCGVGHSVMGGEVVVMPAISDTFIDSYLNNYYDLGEEFTDSNNNGVWDEGEDFTDELNGKYDTGEELVLDHNGNGKFDPGYDYWLERKRIKSNENELLTGSKRGEWLYDKLACVTCHSNGDNNINIGPSFVGLYNTVQYHTDGTNAVADETYLEESIRYPGRKIIKGYSNQMPKDYRDLSKKDLIGLIEYIKSLK